jgi:hypothetical protein
VQREGVSLLNYDNHHEISGLSQILCIIWYTLGPRTFTEAGSLCWFSDHLIVLGVRMSENPDKYSDFENIVKLLWKILHHRHHGSRRRWLIQLMSPLELLLGSELTVSKVGCMNFETCPQRKELRHLRQQQSQSSPLVTLGLPETQQSMRSGFMDGFGVDIHFCGG